MSDRDEWRQGPDYPQDNLDERAVSDRGVGFVSPENREEYRFNRQASAGHPYMKGVAYTALAAAGAYMGLRHFAPQHLQRAQNFMTKQLTQLTQRSSGSSWLTKIQQWVSRGPASRQIAGILDEDLARDVELARDLFSTQSGYVGNRDQIISSMLQRYSSVNPLQVPVPTQYPQQIRALANMPAFQRSAARLGMHPQDVASRLAEAAVRPGEPTMGETIARALGSVRFPFTQWRPLELMMPTELLRRGPALARLGTENLYGVPELAAVAPQGMREAMHMGGRIFGVEELRSGNQFYKIIQAQSMGEGFQLGRLGSGMGKAAAARMGATIARPLTDILTEVPELGPPLQVGQGITDVWKMPGMTFWQKIQRTALEVGERYGIGPQYSNRIAFGGRVRGVVDTLRAAATQADFRPANIPQQVFGVTPEGEWLKKNILAPIGFARDNPIRSPSDLSWFERQLLTIGIHPRRTVERIIGGRAVRERVPVGQLINAAGMEIKRELPFTKSTAMRGEFYAFKGANQGLSDWFNYHINRPTWLMQELTGMGLKPGKGPMESLWRIGTRIALPAYIGWQGLQYADYKSRRWFGYGPISGPAVLYTKLRTEAQKVLDSVGITSKAQELEDKYPGLVESPLSKGAVMIGAPLGGAVLGRGIGGAKGGAIGAAAGLAAGLIYGTGITKPAEELRQIYEGERDVPVRADRWWTLGRQPFGGSRIKYWKKHWLVELLSDYKEKSLYGNRKEAWRGSWLPTPENWLLLKNLYDPYYLENLHYHDRPYPMTSPMFEDVPLVGPLLGATAGRILKPTQYRPYSMPDNTGGPMGSGQAQAGQLGLEPYPVQNQIPVTKYKMAQLTGETLYRLFDWTGLPGFAIGAAKEAATGRQGWFEDQTLLAASGMMTSSERGFYDKNLGGLLGGTEFLRRFIPRGRRNAIYNPIDNVAPEWLPGHRSVFPGDRRGYLDFQSGDPYTAIERGEGRLPGAGYEALNELHSGERGVYDSFDRFKVLADVAPFSDAFKHYKYAVDTMVRQRQLSKQDTDRYYQTLDNLEERVESKVSTYSNRFSSGAFARDTVTIAKLTGSTTFQVHEMPGTTFKLAGVKDRTPDMDSTEFGAYQRLKEKMANMVGQQVEMSWGGPGVETPAMIEGLNREAIRSGLKAERITGLGYQAAYGAGGLPALYEKMIHFSPPAPLDYFRTKWLGVRSPTEEYEQFQVYGTANTNWSHPFRNYILPWASSWSKTPTAESIRARQITEYMDNVRWMKSQRMANMAEDNGNLSLAQEFRHDSRHSLTALQPSEQDYWKNIYSALPPAERPYFNVFAGTSSEEEQERIMESVPEYMRHHYIGLWKRKMPGGEFNSPILQRYAQEAEARAKIPVDVRVAEFFGQYPMPPKDWMGWHPGVDLEAVTIKTANQESIDIHQLGYWESQALRSEQMYPSLEGVDIDQPPDTSERDELMTRMHAAGYTDIQASPTFSIDDRPTTRIEARRSRRKFTEHRNSPFNAGKYTGGDW